jgi:hypothetical protein
MAVAEVRLAVLAMEGMRLESQLVDASARLFRASGRQAACEAACAVAASRWEAAERAARYDEGVGPEGQTVAALEAGRAERLAAMTGLRPELDAAQQAVVSAAAEVALAEAEELSARQALERHRRVVGRRQAAGRSGESG